MMIEGEEEFEVEEILDHRPKSGAIKEYLLKWLSYGPEHNMWVPVRDMEHSQDLIAEYKQSRKRSRHR